MRPVVQLFALVIAGACFIAPLSVQAADFAHDQTLNVAGTTANNRFGETVAATDTYLAAGAPIDDTIDVDAGAVYLYEKVGGTWTYRQKITASDGAAGDHFGTSLTMNGTTLIVGSPSDDIGTAVDAGSVYSFDLETDTWLQTEKMTMPNPVSYERFGQAVDMTEERLVVGVPGYNGATSATTFGRGAITVWDRQGINWDNYYLYTYTSPVAATRPAAFGYSVAISGDKIAVGAPRDYAATSGQGASAGSMSVLAYSGDTSDWASEGRFISTTPVASDFYGNTVDIQGNTLVTANYNISSAPPKIFTYTHANGAWSAPTIIVPTGASISRRYIGQAIEIAPDQSSILVGSHVTYVSTDFVGRVFVLKPNETTGTWEQAQVIASPNAPTSAGWFGYDVAYAGASPVVASPMVTSVTNTRGAIYTYSQGDATPPTLTLSSSSPQYVKNPYSVTIDASEPVSGFTQADISINSSATLSNFTQVNPSKYTVTVTPSSDGPYTMNIDAGTMQDAAGNGNTASSNFVRIYDTTAPIATVLTPTQSTYFSSPTISASVRINDANGNLAGLTADDISISNGTISDFSTASNATSVTGTFTITPTSQGSIDFSVKAAAVADQAGTDSQASATRTIHYDTGKPTPSFSTPLNPTNASPFEVTLSFDEPVADIQDVSMGQISINGGTIDNFQRVTAQEYTFDATPDGAGTVTFGFATGQVSDAAGNTNNAATDYEVVFDNFGPEVTISSADTATNQSPIEFTMTLSEPVSGLTLDDFTLANGTASSLTQTSATTYSMMVTPDANGDVSVSLPAQKATDSSGNGNQASNTLTVNYDDREPVAVVSHSYSSPTNATPLIYTIRFSELVSNLTSDGISLTNASFVSLTKIDAREYTLSVTPTDGQVAVEVTAGAVTDIAGNPNTEDTSTLTSDRTAPTGTVTELHTNNLRPGISGTTSEAVDTVAVTIDGKTFNASINNTNRTWAISANLFGPLADDTYDVTVSITDLAGNVGIDTTNDELIIDTDQPTVTIEAERAETNQNPVTFNMQSSRDITGLESSDFTATNGTVASVTETDSNTYVVSVTPQAQGDVRLQLRENTVVDDAGNENPASNIAESIYDTVQPQISLTGATTPTKNSFTVIANATEAIDSLTVDDVIVTGGTATTVQKQTDQRYVISIQPTAEGTIEVQVPASRTTDKASNGNQASNIFERTYDATAPDTPTVNSQTVMTRQPTLTGTFDSNSTAVLRITIGSDIYYSNAADTPIEISSDDWLLDFSKTSTRLEYGTYDIRVVTTDAAGNSSSDNSHDELIINSPGEIAGTVDEKITANTRPELSGTVSRQNATVDVKILDNIYRATNNRDGSWTLPADTIEALAGGTYDVELTFVDGTLEGSDSTKDELTIDTTAPRGTFTRIVTEDTSPRIYGTVDTSGTRVQVELEGKMYEADVHSDNRWVIERGTISPALTPGTHFAVLYLQRNDKEAMETVRRAITVRGDAATPQPPAEESTNGDESTPAPQPEDPSTDKENTKDVSARSDHNDSQDNDSNASTGKDTTDKSPTATELDEKKNSEHTHAKNMSIVAAAICTLALAGASIIFIIGWKHKHKKDRDEIL